MLADSSRAPDALVSLDAEKKISVAAAVVVSAQALSISVERRRGGLGVGRRWEAEVVVYGWMRQARARTVLGDTTKRVKTKTRCAQMACS